MPTSIAVILIEVEYAMDMQETRASGYDWTGSPYGGT